MKPPYPYFGGKSRVAPEIWRRFGDIRNYVEPFFGGGAVLLGRPEPFRGPETVNDIDGYLCNFWRALAADPAGVAQWADWPVNELDLHARHDWLIRRREEVEKLRADPDYYDVHIAGWWVWGICAWIGSWWCARNSKQAPHLSNARVDVHRASLGDRRRPALGDSGMGVHRASLGDKTRPFLSHSGMGIHGNGIFGNLQAMFEELAARMRRVRVCCGDWSRVMGRSVTTGHGITGVFLDPPYTVADRANCYGHDSRMVGYDAWEWAMEHGDDPKLRIALCGYDGEYVIPGTWTTWAWKANGGMGNQAGGKNRNRHRERIWFSPHCLAGSDERRNRQ